MRQILSTTSHILASLVLLAALSSCSNKVDQQVAVGLEGLYNQVSQSCLSAQEYQKRVSDFNINPAQHQDSVYSLRENSEDPIACPICQDLQDAYSVYFEQEGLQSYFDKRRSGDTLIGEIKPEYHSGIALKYQKILKSGDKILYFESFTSKKSWLYELDLHTRLFFNTNGLYEGHSLDIYNSVPLLKEEFLSRIEGKALYP